MQAAFRTNCSCYFCELISEDIIPICKYTGYHRECMQKELAKRSPLTISCQSKKCKKGDGDGHTKEFNRVFKSRFDGRWREITSNLLAFIVVSCTFGSVIGNSPNGRGFIYNWVPQALIWSFFIANLSHFVTYGHETKLLDAWALLVLAAAAATLYYDNVPQFIEFFAGAAYAGGITLFGFFSWWLGGKLKKMCGCCWRMCRDGVVVETYEVSE